MKFPKLFGRKKDQPGQSKNPNKVGQRAKEIAQHVFGLEKSDKSKYLKSEGLNEAEVVAALAKLETNQNWIKRILWLVVLGSIGEHFVG